MIAAALAMACLGAAATPAPAAPVVRLEGVEAAAVAARLAGHRFTVAADSTSLRIDDVAGMGAPWVGVVERRGEALWLVTEHGAWRLRGPLARPRIAGPGYQIWAVGHVAGNELCLARLGVLRRPREGWDVVPAIR